MREYSLTTKKFAACAAMACCGLSIMILVPYEMVIYLVGLTTMAFIIAILLFGTDKKVVA